jgi:hypothetical protein
MKAKVFEPSPLAKALHSRGLTIETFAAMADNRNYPQSQAYEDLTFLAAGGDPCHFLKIELLFVLSKINIDFYKLREDLKTWSRNLPYSY